ncbi:hypothetical protein [Papillibacter cinnamivorans]|uniref:Uncharacterized protein n=1 Tax=Papillibacter cinnamivorans DSM 12816 TaxID=1122930 RepID=A0A1W1YJI8_9FIRM|nr:hypothetical protein [Papillibacter cinnamivorans]SMC35951.1 hypothetical protein SAMN02745168_0447 [Papillibacter cinnamivorans DSM 12816]
MSLKLLKIVFGNAQIGITTDGGTYEVFINATGSSSVKGTIVVASKTVQGGVSTAPAGSVVPIGVIYETGIDVGQKVKVVTYGKAQVLLASDQTSSTGFWCGVSSAEEGKMYQEANAPIGTSAHNQEIGHSLQTVSTAGALSLVQLHFN